MRVKTTRVVILLGVGITALVIIAYIMIVIPRGELGEKMGWSVLQGVELSHRSDPEVHNPILLFNPMGSQYVVLGVPTNNSKFPRVWVILNETTPTSSVYRLPQNQQFHLPCLYIVDLSAKTKINPQVLELLRHHCAP